MSKENIRVEIRKVPDGNIKLITRTSKESFFETFPDKQTALDNRAKLKFAYKLHDCVFMIGGISTFLAALNLVIESRDWNFPKSGAIALAIGFYFVSERLSYVNSQKGKIVSEQISKLKSFD